VAVYTSGIRIAGVVGARILVIARDSRATARTVETGIVERTFTSVIAAGRIRCVNTAEQRVTRVICTGIVVVAVGRIGLVNTTGCNIARVIGTDVRIIAIHHSTPAAAVATTVVFRAGVLVVACSGIVVVLASQGGIAGVIRAYIFVIARYGGVSNAGATDTDIARSAGIVVITGVCIVGWDTSISRIASVIRTRIAIAAIRRRTAPTRTV
jgi:hypothetical protein